MRRRPRLLIPPVLFATVLALVPVAGHVSEPETESEPAVLSGASGPDHATTVATSGDADWRRYAGGARNRLAILLTNEDSAWTGLAHGLATIGVPFTITDDATTATRHDVVIAYPMIAGSTLDRDELFALRDYVADGGTLVGVQVLGGGMHGVFGFEEAVAARDRYELRLAPGHELTAGLQHPRERSIRLGNPDRPATIMGTYAYTSPSSIVARYQDGTPAITEHAYGAGRAIGVGFDIGFFILKGYNDRDEDSFRAYINDYEPSVDVVLRLLKSIYRRGEPDAVTLWTVPDGKRLSVMITHDVDYSGSLENSIAYAAYQRSRGIRATYFMQTKYYRDYFDEIFFDEDSPDLLAELESMDMEIASHSVSHTDVFASIPLGDGRERYPDYQPRVVKMEDTRGATVLGELRVSKYLLERYIDSRVVSFRPGFLAYPNVLPQALEATGYRYSSSIAAGNALTHLPFRLNYGRGYEAATGVFEFPLSIEDEKPPRMDRRVDEAVALAEQLATYGATCVVLIHPNVTGHKLRFLERFVPRVEPWSWFGTLGEFGDWWAARDAVRVDIEHDGARRIVTLTAERALSGLRLDVPASYRLVDPGATGATTSRGGVLLDRVAGTRRLVFVDERRTEPRRDTRDDRSDDGAERRLPAAVPARLMNTARGRAFRRRALGASRP